MDVFREGLCWAFYRNMEAEFIRFLEYVPYTDENRKVYSPKLLAMLLQICGYIDTVFKEMAKFPHFADIPECQRINSLESNNYMGYTIVHARDAFEKIYHLSSNNDGGDLDAKLDWISPTSLRSRLRPFAAFGENASPNWWRQYNRVKHTWSSSIEEANLDNVLESLSGAFLLNVVHYPSLIFLWVKGELKPIEWSKGTERYEHVIMLERHVIHGLMEDAMNSLKVFHPYIVETPLFIYIKYNGDFVPTAPT